MTHKQLCFGQLFRVATWMVKEWAAPAGKNISGVRAKSEEFWEPGLCRPIGDDNNGQHIFMFDLFKYTADQVKRWKNIGKQACPWLRECIHGLCARVWLPSHIPWKLVVEPGSKEVNVRLT